MKRFSIILRKVLAVVFLCSILGIQQSYTQDKFHVGARAGLNYSTLFGDTYSGLKFKPGLAIGGIFLYDHTVNWTFQAELYYSAEGARNNNYNYGNNTVYKLILRYNYINLPLIAKYRFNEKWNVHAGPQVGFLLCAKEVRKLKSGNPDPEDNQEGTRNISARVRNVYFSFFVGGGFNWNPDWAVQARFYFSGMDKITNDGGDSEGTYPLIFQFTVSYRIFSF